MMLFDILIFKPHLFEKERGNVKKFIWRKNLNFFGSKIFFEFFQNIKFSLYINPKRNLKRKRVLKNVNKKKILIEKGAFFPRLWGYFWRLTIYFRIQPGFWSKNSLLGCPNIFILMYLNFLWSKIFCLNGPKLVVTT